MEENLWLRWEMSSYYEVCAYLVRIGVAPVELRFVPAEEHGERSFYEGLFPKTQAEAIAPCLAERGWSRGDRVGTHATPSLREWRTFSWLEYCHDIVARRIFAGGVRTRNAVWMVNEANARVWRCEVHPDDALAFEEFMAGKHNFLYVEPLRT